MPPRVGGFMFDQREKEGPRNTNHRYHAGNCAHHRHSGKRQHHPGWVGPYLTKELASKPVLNTHTNHSSPIIIRIFFSFYHCFDLCQHKKIWRACLSPPWQTIILSSSPIKIILLSFPSSFLSTLMSVRLIHIQACVLAARKTIIHAFESKQFPALSQPHLNINVHNQITFQFSYSFFSFQINNQCILYNLLDLKISNSS